MKKFIQPFLDCIERFLDKRRMAKAQKIIQKWQYINNPKEMLNLSNLGLKQLPPIPQECQFFDCSYNNLTTLPDLPQCRFLDCRNNKLSYLPELKECHYLNCTYNNLIKLPNPNKQGTDLFFVGPCAIYLLAHHNNWFDKTPISNDPNRYTYVTPQQAKLYRLNATSNYHMYAKIIQKGYRYYKIKQAIKVLLVPYLLKDPIKIVSLYF
jgi:hypothetical protein